MRASAPDSEMNRVRIELEMLNNRQGVTLMPGLSRPPPSCDRWLAGRNEAKKPSLLFLLHLHTVISNILIILEPERTHPRREVQDMVQIWFPWLCKFLPMLGWVDRLALDWWNHLQQRSSAVEINGWGILFTLYLHQQLASVLASGWKMSGPTAAARYFDE
jgi:hypothetical protein